MKIYVLQLEETKRRDNGKEDILYKSVVGVFRRLDKAQEVLKRKALFIERTRHADITGDNGIMKELRIGEKAYYTLWIEVYETE